MCKREHVVSRLSNTSGASIVIALVFFLICAIIGSVVVTAASVEAKSVSTHKALQQAEYSVGSAAQAVGSDMQTASLTVGGTKAEPTVGVESSTSDMFASSFWEKYGSDILKARATQSSGASYVFNRKLTVEVPNKSDMNVYGTIKVDYNLDIEILLSLNENSSSDSPYNMMVTLQCIPTYNAKGELQAFAYEPAVVQKEGATA